MVAGLPTDYSQHIYKHTHIISLYIMGIQHLISKRIWIFHGRTYPENATRKLVKKYLEIINLSKKPIKKKLNFTTTKNNI